MWNLKCKIIAVRIGATEMVTKGLKKNFEAIPGKHSVDSLQKAAVLGTSNIIRKVQQSGTLKPERWGSRLVQGEKYQGENACDERRNNNNRPIISVTM